MLGFSPLSSTPLSALPKTTGGAISAFITESASATDVVDTIDISRVYETVSSSDNQSNIVTFDGRITESGSSNHTQVTTGSIFNVNLTENSNTSATETETGSVTYPTQTITETGSVSDSAIGYFIIYIAETLYAGDVSTTYKSWIGVNPEYTTSDTTNIIVDPSPYQWVNGSFMNAQASTIAPSTKLGIGFTASKTGQLGTVYVSVSIIPGTSTNLGSIELWQLSGANGTSPSVLLASITGTNSSLKNYIDFSNISGAALTSGTSYCILFTAGSDWQFPNPTGYASGAFAQVPTVYDTAAVMNSYIDSAYNGLYYYVGSGTVGSAGSGYSTTALNTTTAKASSLSITAFIIKYASGSTLVDTEDAINAIPIKETASATDSLSLTMAANAWGTNKSSFVDNITGNFFTSDNTSTTGRGVIFTANKTETVSNVSIPVYRINNNNYGSANPVTKGSVQLWNVTSGAPSQLLASKDFSLSDLPNPVSSITSISSSLLGAAALTSSVTPTSGSSDDGYWQLDFPWTVNFLGNSYNTAYIGTNSYITFGLPSAAYSPISQSYPSVPKIMVCAADRWAGRIFYGTEGTAPNRTYRVVYEGHFTFNTPPAVGSADWTWEAVFYENNPSQIDIQVGLNTGISLVSISTQNGATTNFGVATAEAQVGYFAYGGSYLSGAPTNVGYRIISNTNTSTATNTVSPYQPTTFDFSSTPVTLTLGNQYAVTVTPGTDWTTSASSYMGLHILDTNQYHGYGNQGALLPGYTQLGAQQTYFYNSVLYSPIASQSNSSWLTNFAESSAYFLAAFIVNGTSDTYAKDINVGTSPNNFDVRETGTVLDSNTYISTISSTATEFGNSRDSTTSLRKVGSALVETTSGRAPLFNDYQFSTVTGGGIAVNPNARLGWGFTATTTGQLGKVSWFRGGTGGYGNYSNGNATPSVSNGALELWRLAGAPGTAATTLVASIPVAATDFPSTGPAPLWDFSNISGAVLVAGISYAVIFSTGSDWSYTTTKTWSIQTSNTSGTDPAAWFGYRMGKVYYSGTGTVGTTTGLTSGTAWSTTTDPNNTAIPPLSIEYASNTLDLETGVMVTTQTVTENTGISATETETGVIPGAGENVNETGSASETESNTVAFVSDRTETGTATETETSQADFYPAITETGSANETEDRSLTATRDVTETGSANETEDRSLTATRDVTETGSANETEDRTVTATRDVTETGTASETEDRTVTATRDITETGSANETEDRTVTATRDVTETGSANETELGTYTTSAALTENTGISAVDNETGAITQIQYNTETGSASETETSQANFYPAITETVSGVDSEDSNYITASSLTETGSGNESNSGSNTTNQTRTETGSATETETNVISTNQSLTETSSATETETSQANFYPVITETGSGNESNSGSNTTNQTRTETGSATETESSSAAFVSSNTETGSASETETNVISTNQSLTETGTASETETSQANFYPTRTETGSASDSESATAVDLGNIVETLLGQDLSTVQTAFISAIQEAITALESGVGNIITTSNISEFVNANDNQTRYAFYAADINELLNAIVIARTDIPAFITETGSLTTVQFATLLQNAGILEQVTATEEELAQLITTSYITEIVVAGEQTVVWVFFPMDYELVSSRYSSLIEVDSDQIYADNIDVFYLDASKIMVGMDVSFDQIYVDNVDVLYGNIAIIDDIVSDEIYI